MASRTLLLAVEGPHDAEFCARLLRNSDFGRIRSFKDLRKSHDYWCRIIPEKWPHNGDDLLARHPVPLFLANTLGDSIAIVSANGVSRIARRIGYTLDNLFSLPDAVGVILDADDAATPGRRFGEFRSEIGRLNDSAAKSFMWPDSPGVVEIGPPRTGVFVMPDNQSQGTLEDLLLGAAGISYPGLLRVATDYVADATRANGLYPGDLEELNKPAGTKKAVCSTIASILRPGKSIQASIQDNRWLDPDVLKLPAIQRVHTFLHHLLIP